MVIRLIMACHWHPANIAYQFVYRLVTLVNLAATRSTAGEACMTYTKRAVVSNILDLMDDLAKITLQTAVIGGITECLQ